MPDKHLSTQFDADLTSISTKVLQMGGLVEAQITRAMRALSTFDQKLIDEVNANEILVNQAEVEIDEACNNIIARRQPAARDLRLMMAISKTITNLERAGDEAVKIARCTRNIMQDPAAHAVNFSEVKLSGQMAAEILHHALDAFARLDVVEAVAIMKEDQAIDDEFRGFVRKLVTYMMEDPHTISVGLDFLFVAKALERIGDHAKNIAEYIIYIVKGTDVRHLSQDVLEKQTFE